jgi:hypothetical protein
MAPRSVLALLARDAARSRAEFGALDRRRLAMRLGIRPA